jgi:two-component system cell cycle sensor histidine kinase/response regulator CckA
MSWILRALRGRENIELVSELADDLGLVKIDLAQSQQIILNLVLNARDAMPDGGRVILSTRNCDGPIMERDARNQFCDSWVSFVVCDTGCGMDAETLSRLFEPFFTTKQPGKGNGLGLATVHRIVTQEGGSRSRKRAWKRHAGACAPAPS